MEASKVRGVEVASSRPATAAEVLTPDALSFLAELERQFRGSRAHLLARRQERQAEIDAGRDHLGLLAETAAVRLDPTWRVAETPPDLLDRRGENTGPAPPQKTNKAPKSRGRALIA